MEVVVICTLTVCLAVTVFLFYVALRRFASLNHALQAAYRHLYETATAQDELRISQINVLMHNMFPYVNSMAQISSIADCTITEGIDKPEEAITTVMFHFNQAGRNKLVDAVVAARNISKHIADHGVFNSRKETTNCAALQNFPQT